MTGKRCLVALLAVAAIGGLAAATPRASDVRPAIENTSATETAEFTPAITTSEAPAAGEKGHQFGETDAEMPMLISPGALRSCGPASPPGSEVVDMIFVLDGSGSMSESAFALQKQGIRNCLCGPDAFVPADGTAAIAVIQYGITHNVEVGLTTVDSPATAALLCDCILGIQQIGGATNLLTALKTAGTMLGEDTGSFHRLILSGDAGVENENGVLQECENLRTRSTPVRICTVLVDTPCDYLQSARWINFFKNCANTPDAPNYDPGQIAGCYACAVGLPDVGVFGLLCRECNCELTHVGSPDCNENGIPDACEQDAECSCLGDVNVDSTIDLDDIDPFVCCLLYSQCPCADLDKNGHVDGRDIAGFVRALLDDLSCTPAACCLPGGSCEVIAETNCIASGGEYLDGETCGATGACCLSGGSCTVTSEACCTEAGGDFAGAGTTCLPTGACCKPDGSCEVMAEACCTEAGGDFAGAGTTCEPTGACCKSDGSCAVMAEACCIDGGGDFAGPGTTCQPTGACCKSDGSCEIMAEACCVDVGGDFAGSGTTCQPTGACCMPDGSCAVTAEACCLEAGGDFAGSGTTCQPTGACCLPDAPCENGMVEACCEAAGGVFVGVGTTCPGFVDCNNNGSSDFCDILIGTSQDCNGNGVPDECDVLPQTMYAVDADSLYTVNPATGACQLVGDLNPDPGAVEGLSAHPMTAELYAVAYKGGKPPPLYPYRLLRVNKQTAAVQIIGGMDRFLYDIAFRADGTLFGIDSAGAIVVVNTTDATFTETGCTASASSQHSIAFCPGSNLLYHHVTTAPSHIETIDLTTCAKQSVGGTCNLSRVFQCMAFTPTGGNLLLFSNNPSNGSLYQAPVTACNPTCNLTLVGSACGQQITGMTYAPFSTDCNHDGIPDECQLVNNDCNHNGIPDDCEQVDCGVCCHHADNQCVAPEGRENCSGPCDRFISYSQDPDATCDDFVNPSCGQGACCLGVGQCEMKTRAECDALMGSWMHDRTCAQVACNPPANDSCANAITLTGTCTTAQFDSTSATRDVLGGSYYTISCLVGETPGVTDDDVQVANNIWYKYEIPTMYDGYPVTAGEVVISTLGSRFDTVLAVWGTLGNAAGCGQAGAITCGTISAITEITCNDDIVAPGYTEHEPVEASYVSVFVSEYDGMPPGSCIYIMVSGKVDPESPCSPRGGEGQLNLDFIPRMEPWDGNDVGVCCTATGCFIATYSGDCNSAGGYLRTWADFYEGYTTGAPAPFDTGVRAGGCCHDLPGGPDISSCQEGEYCGKAIVLSDYYSPDSNLVWPDDFPPATGLVHRVTYFKFTPRDLIGTEEEYYITIDTCGSAFDTVLSVYDGGYDTIDYQGECKGIYDQYLLIARNDNCTPAGVPGAVGKVSCIAASEVDSCLCLKVSWYEGLIPGVGTYYIGVGKKDTHGYRAEGIDPEPNYPIDDAVGLKVTIKDTWTNCGS